MCVCPYVKQSAGWEWGVDGIRAIDFLEGYCSYTNRMQTFGGKLRYI